MSSVIVSRPNKALLLPRTPRIEALFPQGRPLDDRIVVQHNLHATVVARALGFQVPNPMLCYYNWCGGTPFAVQRATCDLMSTAARCYVLNSMAPAEYAAEILYPWGAPTGIIGAMPAFCKLDVKPVPTDAELDQLQADGVLTDRVPALPDRRRALPDRVAPRREALLDQQPVRDVPPEVMTTYDRHGRHGGAGGCRR